MRSSILLRLERSYEPIAKDEQRASLISRFIYRPVSFYLTIPFVLINSSANAVTLLRLPMATIAAVLVAMGYRQWLLVGSIFYAIGMLLDYVDGNLARLHKTAGILGEFLDGSVHIFERSVFPIGVAVGLCFRPDQFCRTFGASTRLILSTGFLVSMVAFLRTTLSVLQFMVNQLRIGSPSQNPQSAAHQFTVASSDAIHPSTVQVAKYVVRRLLTEGAFFLDGIGVVVFAACDVMSAFLIAVGIQNAFRLRDESRMMLDLFSKHPKKVTAEQER